MNPLPNEWVPRWLLCLMDPLVDTETRVETDHAMTSIVAAQPRWWAAYASGFVADLIATLDPEDPWRSLHIDGGRVVLGRRSVFGTWTGFTDLVRPTVRDLRADLSLGAVLKPLDRRGSLLLAHACRGRNAAQRFLLREIGPTNALDQLQADDLFTSTARAVRFAAHRRREFYGHEDPFIRLDGELWIGRADKILAGERLDEGRIASSVDVNRVDPGSYKSSAGPRLMVTEDGRLAEEPPEDR